MDVNKSKGEETPLGIFREEEWKNWTTVHIRGRMTKDGKALLSDELLLAYRGMFYNV